MRPHVILHASDCFFGYWNCRRFGRISRNIKTVENNWYPVISGTEKKPVYNERQRKCVLHSLRCRWLLK